MNSNALVTDVLTANNINNIANTLRPSNTLSTNDDIVAIVNGWPITEGEIAYRTAVSQGANKPIDSNYIFNKLVEEKVKLSEAERLGVLPTNAELEADINSRKQEVADGTELGQAISSFIEETQMDENDYWNFYEVYNEYRYLAFTNYSIALEEAALADDLIAPFDATAEQLADYEYSNAQENYWDTVAEKKSSANIQVFNNDYTPEKTKLFTAPSASIQGSEKETVLELVAAQPVVIEPVMAAARSTRASGYSPNLNASDTKTTTWYHDD